MWDDEMDSISTPATSSSAWDSYTRTHASAKPIFHSLLYRLEGLKVTQGLQRHGISDLVRTISESLHRELSQMASLGAFWSILIKLSDNVSADRSQKTTTRAG